MEEINLKPYLNQAVDYLSLGYEQFRNQTLSKEKMLHIINTAFKDFDKVKQLLLEEIEEN